ncbi:MAG TPA: hypothetical protein PKM59_10695 [Thermodesulfobacteriota bacterium]|nr:hypothetical protein [Deltaproteobacteria bacterium]HNR13773.1 hypothetical protein [Thermodesulfobacteriota bacterium]
MENFIESCASALLVTIPFVLVFSFVFAEIRKKIRKQAELAALDTTLDELKKKIIVVSDATIPGREIEHDYGEIEATGTAGYGHLRIAEKRALILLLRKAQEMGANAIVNLHRLRATEPGTGQLSIRAILLSGKAVRTRKKSRKKKSKDS